MKPFKISSIPTRLSVRFSDKKVQLPREIQQKIDIYWEELIASGKRYTRGEVFTVTNKKVTNEAIAVLVEKTDYAHYLYCQNVQLLGGYGVHIIHTAALVKTSDGYIIFGEMGPHTARAGIYQLCGGGIDNDDLDGEYFDLKHNIQKELLEELNIDVVDKLRVNYFDSKYFKEGGPTDKMTVIYEVVLNEAKDDFLKNYQQFADSLKSRGELPEFEKLIAIRNDSKSIQQFFAQKEIDCDEYMYPLFEYIGKSRL